MTTPRETDVVVSVECVPCACRQAVLAWLAGARGLHPTGPVAGPVAGPAAGDETAASLASLGAVLRNLKGLARARRPALWTDSWLAGVPLAERDPAAHALRVDLGRATARALGLAPRHVALCLHVPVHEAFEHALEESARAKTRCAVDIATLGRHQARAEGAAADSPWWPFKQAEVHHVHCPPFVADNPVALAALLAEIGTVLDSVLDSVLDTVLDSAPT